MPLPRSDSITGHQRVVSERNVPPLAALTMIAFPCSAGMTAVIADDSGDREVTVLDGWERAMGVSRVVATMSVSARPGSRGTPG